MNPKTFWFKIPSEMKNQFIEIPGMAFFWSLEYVFEYFGWRNKNIKQKSILLEMV